MSTLSDVLAETACPACGEFQLTVETRLTAKPIGDFSLSGMQLKVTAIEEVWIRCQRCGVEAKGHK